MGSRLWLLFAISATMLMADTASTITSFISFPGARFRVPKWGRLRQEKGTRPIGENGTLAGACLAALLPMVLLLQSRKGELKALHGEDVSVQGSDFVVLGLAHCFEEDEDCLRDVWVLEPVAASTVEVINNGAATSYEALCATTVDHVLQQDLSALPEGLLRGHEVQWGQNLEFRTGCASRTWKRQHAREVVMKLVPPGQIFSKCNTSLDHKRVLNFVNVVKDSDNIKQDISIDVYGRAKENA